MSNEERRDALVEALRDTAYVCGRVWEAWQVGTMTEDDFSPAWENDELIESLMDALDAPVSPVIGSVTPRGFGMYAELPYLTYDNHPEEVGFTVQESSAADERRVWIGAGSQRAHLTEDQARKVRDGLSAFLGDTPFEVVSRATPTPTGEPR